MKDWRKEIPEEFDKNGPLVRSVGELVEQLKKLPPQLGLEHCCLEIIVYDIDGEDPYVSFQPALLWSEG